MSEWYQSMIEEHEAVLDAVDSLWLYSSYLVRGGKPRKKMLEGILDFVVNFADGCHHMKEEDALFPAIRGKPTKERTMVDLLIVEHEQGRAYVKTLMSGSDDAIIRAAHGYCALLSAHIAKENPYFLECDGLCSALERRKISDGFRRIEKAGIGEKRHRHYIMKARELKKAAMRL